MLDPSLSPPVIDKPIPNCAQTIALSGADRDAKIAVYVDGTEATQVPDLDGLAKHQAALHAPRRGRRGGAQIVSNRSS